MECSRELDQGVERLNINLGSWDRLLLRLSIWSDGLFWLGVNKPGPRRQEGWQINEQIEGTLVERAPSEIVERLEQSLIRPTDLTSIWDPRRT